MKAKDIIGLSRLGTPTLSIDGSIGSVGITEADPETGSYFRKVMIFHTDSETTSFIPGDGSDVTPKTSPDGKSIAFLRPSVDGAVQIFIWNVESKILQQATSANGGIFEFEWAPDSGSMAFTAYRSVAGQNVEHGIALVTDHPFADTSTGFDRSEKRKIHVVDLNSGLVRQVTHDVFHDDQIAWDPSGSRICYVSRNGSGNALSARSDVWVADLRNDTSWPITHGGFEPMFPCFSVDGNDVVLTGSKLAAEGYSDGFASFGVWTTSASTENDLRRVSDEFYSLSYVSQTLRVAGQKAYIAFDHQGSVPLGGVSLNGVSDEAELLFAPAGQVNGFDIKKTAEGLIWAAVVADFGSAGDLYVGRRKAVTKLTRFGDDFVSSTQLTKPVEISVQSCPGVTVQGWVFVPEGLGPHPVVQVVKGGPYTQFGATMSGPGSFEEAQILCAAGFLVVIGNPRGSAGYGVAHATGASGNLPDVTSRDLQALRDHALANFGGDPARVGVMGGSFGGYMAAWLACTTRDVFAAAVGERGCYSLDSYVGASDDGLNVVNALWGADKPSWKEQSPVTHVSALDCPFLIVHSDGDQHAPFEQARRFFLEAKLFDKEVDMLVFCAGDHESSRSGPLGLRIHRYEQIINWLKTTLG
ncbi:S9 family peptidase [Arthrobacter sp. ISL-48]|uniref:S9 family peptidase n=1 Tax=Arthrobacter sp. ISL-48 TaxID=2819110 RepID=UPI001BE78930|nr:prolyl oligopeptidase family serine peptidase [Arthrobacter sp. ISL-48]MBT2531249.1 S9 family peptidase [Arthrobacter sp. ISL-48]